MLARTAHFMLLGTTAFTAVQAQYAGNEAAVEACKGFAPGVFKCLTDVSYVVCNYGNEVEQFVAAGTHCEQGIPYQRKDAVDVPGVATLTRIFVQNPPASSEAAASLPADSAAAAPTPSAAPSPASTDPAAADATSVLSGFAAGLASIAAAASGQASSFPTSAASAADSSATASTDAALTPSVSPSATANTISLVSTADGTFATISAPAAS